jgi:hypothetical protein
MFSSALSSRPPHVTAPQAAGAAPTCAGLVLPARVSRPAGSRASAPRCAARARERARRPPRVHARAARPHLRGRSCRWARPCPRRTRPAGSTAARPCGPSPRRRPSWRGCKRAGARCGRVTAGGVDRHPWEDESSALACLRTRLTCHCQRDQRSHVRALCCVLGAFLRVAGAAARAPMDAAARQARLRAAITAQLAATPPASAGPASPGHDAVRCRCADRRARCTGTASSRVDFARVRARRRARCSAWLRVSQRCASAAQPRARGGAVRLGRGAASPAAHRALTTRVPSPACQLAASPPPSPLRQQSAPVGSVPGLPRDSQGRRAVRLKACGCGSHAPALTGKTPLRGTAALQEAPSWASGAADEPPLSRMSASARPSRPHVRGAPEPEPARQRRTSVSERLAAANQEAAAVAAQVRTGAGRPCALVVPRS